jgi:hypothetical protein
MFIWSYIHPHPAATFQLPKDTLKAGNHNLRDDRSINRSHDTRSEQREEEEEEEAAAPPEQEPSYQQNT